MSRAALVALASLVATAACGPAPSAPFTDVTFLWAFRDANNNVFGNYGSGDPGCLGANVDTVLVSITGPAGTINYPAFTCTAPVTFMPGVVLTNLPVGTYSWSLQGQRQGLTVFSASGTSNFVNFPVFQTEMRAVFPNMDLFYNLPPGATCAGVTEIGFELWNGPGQTGSVLEYSSQNVMVSCGAPFGFSMPSIPTGNYGLRYVEAWQAVGPPLYQVCGVGYRPQSPIVQTQSGTGVTVDLVLGSGSWCP